jgi:hypothetical protein
MIKLPLPSGEKVRVRGESSNKLLQPSSSTPSNNYMAYCIHPLEVKYLPAHNGIIPP